ncbi:MAG TPA: hypothetical protein VMU67_01345 [Steroidobacteraceae bacterium]|nr:hypothetical protein [Steroidobacteraceae bacterium]
MEPNGIRSRRGAAAHRIGLLLSLCTLSATHAATPSHITISGERIFPESITSTADGTVIIGSIGQRMIYRARSGAAVARPWITPGTDGMQTIFGVLADDRSRTLWACSNDFGPSGSERPPPATLYAFDLRNGAPKGHYPLPTPGALCNDIVVDTDGTVYATDTNNMEVVRLARGAAHLEVWAGPSGFGPRSGLLYGIAILGRRVLVNTLATSRIFSVPIERGGAAGSVVEVRLDRPLAHPDGMRRFGRDCLLVAQGGEGGRLSRVVVHGDSATVTTLKDGFPDGPVAVTVVGATAYVLEGQLGKFMHPAVPDGTGPLMRLNPFRATAVELVNP